MIYQTQLEELSPNFCYTASLRNAKYLTTSRCRSLPSDQTGNVFFKNFKIHFFPIRNREIILNSESIHSALYLDKCRVSCQFFSMQYSVPNVTFVSGNSAYVNEFIFWISFLFNFAYPWFILIFVYYKFHNSNVAG